MNKKHIIETCKLVTLVILLSYVLDKGIYYIISEIGDTVYSGQSIGKLNQYLKIKDTTETIVYGNSRANHHIDVRKFSQSSYNVGVDGKFIAYSATLIKLLPEKKPQNIILHVDPNVAFRPTYNRKEIKSLMAKYHKNDIIRNELKRAGQNNVFQHFFWCIDFNGLVVGILKNAVFPKYDPNGYYGYDPLPVTEAEKDIFKKVLARKDSISVCRDVIKINETYLNYLKEVNSFCKKNNKNLIIVTSPIFIDNCPDDNAILNSILIKMDVKYYDYTNFYKNNNELKYWRDYAHMSDLGAEKFSNELSQVFSQLKLNE